MADPKPFVDVKYETPLTPPDARQEALSYITQFFNTLEEINIGQGTKSLKADRSGIWLGANLFEGAPFSVDMLGNVVANSILINGLGGDIIAGSIDSNGNFINELISTNLNTQSKEILGSFEFVGSGALDISTDANNGLWISPTGILGKKSGAITFAIENDGDATFGGTLVAASGTFGTITAGTLTGATFQTTAPAAASGRAVVMSGGSNQDIRFYNNENLYAQIGTLTTSSGGEQEYLRIEADSGRSLRFRESNIACDGNFNPTSDNAFSVGTAGKRWSVGNFEDIVVDDLTVNSGCSGCAYIELNLLSGEQKAQIFIDKSAISKEERDAKNYTGFDQGTVLVWKHGKLQDSDMDTCPCVTAVASSIGTPIVLGGELVKVVGKGKQNDFLVTSSLPGYARAWNGNTSGTPPMGTVIGQLMVDKLTNEPELVMAMIRKF